MDTPDKAVTLYYPAGSKYVLERILPDVLKDVAEVISHTPTPLDLAALKCFSVRTQGSLVQARLPFVYPLMCFENHTEALDKALAYPFYRYGADWVYLGGAIQSFLEDLVSYVHAHNIGRVDVHPYTSVVGKFSESAQRDDISLTIVKPPSFHNDTQVKRNKEMLLANTPGNWDPAAYCLVVDRYDSVKSFVDAFLKSPPKKIIEVGCGVGNTSHRLALEFPEAQVIGYDYSLDSLEVCRNSFKLPNLSFEFLDFTKRFPHDDKTIDLVVSIEATNMSAAPIVTASEFCRILTDEGIAINCSLSETSYSYWDYPASLLYPVHMNTFPVDWYIPARQAGLGFQIFPWHLMSFTFIPCRDATFHARHRAFEESRQSTAHYEVYQDRFAMVIGKSVKSLKPDARHAHLIERSYLSFLRQCRHVHAPDDRELLHFTSWAENLVYEALDLLPQGARFIEALMARSAR